MSPKKYLAVAMYMAVLNGVNAFGSYSTGMGFLWNQVKTQAVATQVILALLLAVIFAQGVLAPSARGNTIRTIELSSCWLT